VHGTINHSNQAGHYGLTIDDRNNSAAGREWTVSASGAVIGDLAVNFANVNAPAPYLDTFSKLRLYPNAGSRVAITQELPFHRQEVNGTGGSNTLVGPDFGVFWSLTGIDSGSIALVFPYQRQLDWSGMQSLVGGGGADTFVFGTSPVSGSIDGGGGFNTLHYNLPPTSFVVDLVNGIAPFVAGGVRNFQAVFPEPGEQPTLSINNVSLLEGNAGTKSFEFIVSLSFDPSAPVTVTVNTADGTATLADQDYQAVTNLVLTFQPGDPLTQKVTVFVTGDTTFEPDETFFVTLSNVSGATIASGEGTGTILNDDPDRSSAPSLNIEGPTAGVRSQSLTFLFNVESAALGATGGFSITANWGDGATQSIVVAGGEARRAVTHTYSTEGKFTVQATAVDGTGMVSDSASYQVSIAAVKLMPDPSGSGKLSLFVGGTLGNDSIAIGTAARGQVQVKINGKVQGKYMVTGGLFVYAGAGNDTVSVDAGIKLPALVDGGAGNDTLRAGGGNSILLGGSGNDRLIGGAKRNLLIGGSGGDMLTAGSKGDILIGGATPFDEDYPWLRSIIAEWNSGRAYKKRIANLRGSGDGRGADGGRRLVTTGPEATIIDDGARDQLRGGAGQDWYFGNVSGAARVRIVGRKAGEPIEPTNYGL
jgi:Ca2+-binding RTX toxin-like protein